jgi:hypothetical protein
MHAPEVAYSRNPKVVFRELDGGGVLLHLETGSYHGLNPTGSRLWSLIDGCRRAGDLARALDVEDAPEDLEPRITDFLTDLVARDLVGPVGV